MLLGRRSECAVLDRLLVAARSGHGESMRRHLHDHPGCSNAYALAPEHARMTPAVGSLLWTASSEAVGDELDLHLTVTHLLDGSASPTGAAIVLAAAVVQPESREP